MKSNKIWLLLAFVLTLSAVFLVSSVHATGIDGGYVGTDACLACHDSNGPATTDKTSFLQTGHPYKVRSTKGLTPFDNGTCVRGDTNAEDPAVPAGSICEPLSFKLLNLTPLCANINNLDAGLGDGCGTYFADTTPADGRLDWSSVQYMIGGYLNKARWGLKDNYSGNCGSMTGTGCKTGYIVAGTTQHNFEAALPGNPMEDWSAYSANTDKKYACAICHNTNGIARGNTWNDSGTTLGSRTQPWANMGWTATGDGSVTNKAAWESEWTFDGVQCEACHGKGTNGTSGHGLDGSGTQKVLAITASGATSLNTASISTGATYDAERAALNTGAGGIEICAMCHIRGSNATGGKEWGASSLNRSLRNGAEMQAGSGAETAENTSFVKHHEQYNEMVGLSTGTNTNPNTGDGAHASLTCTTCHDPHQRAHKVTADVADALGIADNTTSPGVITTCESCHQAQADADAANAALNPAGKHADHAAIKCIDCHMAEATRAAPGTGMKGTWGKMGDMKTHFFKIDPAATDIIRSKNTVTDAAGVLIPVAIAKNAFTVDYSCGKCHDSTLASTEGTRGLGAGVTTDLTRAQAVTDATNYHNVTGIDGGYVGSNVCAGCHEAKYDDFYKSGHPWKYRHTGGTDPAGNAWDPITGLYATPLGVDVDTSSLGEDCGNGLVLCNGSSRLDWPAINYAIGGFGWKIRWGVKDATDAKTGYVWTGTTQYNLWNALTPASDEFTAYNANSDKKNECAKCHQTNGMVFTGGYSCYTDPTVSPRTEPLGSNPGMSLVEDNTAAGGNDDGICDTGEGCKIGGYRSMWTFDGVQCEACHGPAKNHVTNSATLGVLETSAGVEICAKCHIRAENTSGQGAECDGSDNAGIRTNGAKITDPWIGHHEQYNELQGLNGDGVHASLNCTDCHDQHKRAKTVTSAVATALGITDNSLSAEDRGAVVSCESCHPGKTLNYDMGSIACVDCHMAEATKTAINYATTGWGRKADLKTHIFKINPAGSSIVRSNGFTNVAQNYITPKYACGKCHDGVIGTAVAMDEADAQSYAANIHNDNPFANFGYTTSGLTANVNASASYCVSGSCTFAWIWGDGNSTPASATATASHPYAAAGTYNVTLTVKDTVRLSTDSKSASITVYALDAKPVADGCGTGELTWNANTWTASCTDTSTDDGTIVQKTVKWGDGTALDTSSPFGPHTYLNPGSRTITHTVKDNAGQTNKETTVVTPAYFLISGTVYRSNGTTVVPSAKIQVKKSGVVVKTVYTATNGTFSAGNLKPGDYTLVVTKTGYTFAPSVAIGAVGPSSTGNNINAVSP